MTAVDRAFIKAYTSRRSVRGTSADKAAAQAKSTLGEITLGGGTASYRVDGPHISATRAPGPHTKSTSPKPQRPSAEHLINGERSPVPGAVAAIDRTTHGERVVVSLADPAATPDWIWQREPHPVFSEAASTAGTAIQAAAAKQPLAKSPPTKAQPVKQPSSKILSPEILSLTLPSVIEGTRTGVPATASPQSEPVPAAAAPLSSFTVVPRVEDRLQPALEVDQFLWPAETDELSEAAATALDGFGTHLIAGARRGQRRIALVGTSPAAGTTTTLLCLARMARVKGVSWGLLDANFDHAALAPQLGIGQTAGWQAVLTGRERLADISIASLEDHLVFVPLAADEIDINELTGNFRAPVLFSMLADIVDLVLVDAGLVAANTGDAQQINRLAALVRAARIDGVYLVYDERSTAAGDLAACGSRLRGAGVSVLGAIANFATS